MKKEVFSIAIVFLILSSCVGKSDFDKLAEENIDLKLELAKSNEELAGYKLKYEALYEVIRQAEIEKSKIPLISEDKALKCIKDYYDFYDRDTQFKNIRIRRVSNNVFNIAIDLQNKSDVKYKGKDAEWSNVVRILTVNNDGSYKYEYYPR